MYGVRVCPPEQLAKSESTTDAAATRDPNFTRRTVAEDRGRRKPSAGLVLRPRLRDPRGSVTDDPGGVDDDDVSAEDSLLRMVAHAPERPSGGGPHTDPERLAHFVIKDRLGQGGMGIVYRAWDEKLRRSVALKVLPSAFEADPEKRRRFLREARSAAAITHANIAAIHDIGEDAGRVFIAMELVEGESLRSRLREGPLSPKEAARIARGVARGLSRAHDKGVVHRDLKPENIVLDADGEPKILDFGLAKLDPRAGGGPPELAATESRLTEEGHLLGTPLYMSPEQMLGEDVDGRSDLFSLGIVLYEMLAGKRPFAGATVGQVLVAITRDEAIPLREVAPEVPESLQAIVERCLRKRRDDRYATARDLQSALDVLPLLSDIPAAGPSVPGGREEALSTRMTAGSTVAARPRAPRGRGRVVALALAAATVLGGLGTLAWRARVEGAATVAPTPSGAPSAPSSGVAMTDHPPPKTANPEAAAEYAAALQALHDGAYTAGDEKLARVTRLDPNLAAAHLRQILYGLGSGSTARKMYAAAAQNRGALSERDRVLLTIAEPLALPDPPDNAEAAKRVRLAAQRWPSDAEIACLAGVLLGTVGELEAAHGELDRAFALDKTFAFALHARVNIESASGDLDGAMATAGRCLEVSPIAAACARRRAEIFAARGQCAAFEVEARRAVAGEPATDNAHRYLVEALAARRAPIEELEDAASAWASTGNADDKAQTREVARRRLDGYTGNLGVAVGHAVEALRLARIQDPTFTGPVAMELYEEIGERPKAVAFADDFLRRAGGLGDPATRGVALQEFRLAGRMSAGELRSQRERAATEVRRLSSPFVSDASGDETWVNLYAASATTPEDARDAIAARPSFPPLPRGAGDLGDRTTLEEKVGRVYLLAGEVDEALTHLRVATAACPPLAALLNYLHAQEELGEALALKGDTAGACAAHRVVLSYWGDAKPRSVTADKSRAQMRRLACPK